MRVVDLIDRLNLPIKVIGIRPGEKLHEVMCPLILYYDTIEFDDHLLSKPSITFTTAVDYLQQNALGEQAIIAADGFDYSSVIIIS